VQGVTAVWSETTSPEASTRLDLAAGASEGAVGAGRLATDTLGGGPEATLGRWMGMALTGSVVFRVTESPLGKPWAPNACTRGPLLA